MNKRLLAVAIGALASASALATPVIDEATTGTSVFATESLVLVNGVGTLNTPDVALSAIGTGVSNSDQLFIRADLAGGAKFDENPTYASANFAAVSIAQGGAGAAYVIFTSTATADSSIADDATIGITDVTVPGTSVASGITVCTYETLSQAVNQTGALGCDSFAGYLSMVSGLVTTVTPFTQTASVNDDFMMFLGGTVNVPRPLGTLSVAARANTLDATSGAQVALTDMIATGANVSVDSVVTYTGDFSFGQFTSQDTVNGGTGNCEGTAIAFTEVVNNVVQASLSAPLGTAFNNPAGSVNLGTLCVAVDGTDSIPITDYTVSVDFRGLTNHPAPTDIGATASGSIVRDGTEIEVDYLTTFSSYNQRIVLTNRGNRDYAYEMTFTTEAGVTATPGAAATGVVKAGEVLVVRTSDAVTFTGGTRGSGVIRIPATTGTVDAAVTQVNLSDGGTDTVYLD